MSLADHKNTKREMQGALNKLQHVCGGVIWLLLKYCIYCALAPILHRESTDSLIHRESTDSLICLEPLFNCQCCSSFGVVVTRTLEECSS